MIDIVLRDCGNDQFLPIIKVTDTGRELYRGERVFGIPAACEKAATVWAGALTPDIATFQEENGLWSKTKYFTKETLILANRVAVAANRNRSLHEEPLLKLPGDLRFPVGFTMLHNDCEMRCQITVAEDALGKGMAQVWLDIPIETFNALPEWETAS